MAPSASFLLALALLSAAAAAAAALPSPWELLEYEVPNICENTWSRPVFEQVLEESLNSTVPPRRLAFAPAHPAAHCAAQDGYRLFRYTEPGAQQAPPADSRAILFVHGNAGSYRQARSLGTTLLREPAKPPLTLYTADLSEELAAASGATLAKHARFVALSLSFLARRHAVFPLFIVAHSVGGTVARLALADLRVRVAALWCVGCPLRRPVAMPDALSAALMAWAERKEARGGGLAAISSVSLAGGARDLLVESHLCAHARCATPSRLNTSRHLCLMTAALVVNETSALRNDHQSLVWCSHVVRALARALSAASAHSPAASFSAAEAYAWLAAPALQAIAAWSEEVRPSAWASHSSTSSQTSCGGWFLERVGTAALPPACADAPSLLVLATDALTGAALCVADSCRRAVPASAGAGLRVAHLAFPGAQRLELLGSGPAWVAQVPASSHRVSGTLRGLRAALGLPSLLGRTQVELGQGGAHRVALAVPAGEELHLRVELEWRSGETQCDSRAALRPLLFVTEARAARRLGDDEEKEEEEGSAALLDERFATGLPATVHFDRRARARNVELWVLLPPRECGAAALVLEPRVAASTLLSLYHHLTLAMRVFCLELARSTLGLRWVKARRVSMLLSTLAMWLVLRWLGPAGEPAPALLPVALVRVLLLLPLRLTFRLLRSTYTLLSVLLATLAVAPLGLALISDQRSTVEALSQHLAAPLSPTLAALPVADKWSPLARVLGLLLGGHSAYAIAAARLALVGAARLQPRDPQLAIVAAVLFPLLLVVAPAHSDPVPELTVGLELWHVVLLVVPLAKRLEPLVGLVAQIAFAR